MAFDRNSSAESSSMSPSSEEPSSENSESMSDSESVTTTGVGRDFFDFLEDFFLALDLGLLLELVEVDFLFRDAGGAAVTKFLALGKKKVDKGLKN